MRTFGAFSPPSMISVPLNLDYKQVSYFALPIDGEASFFVRLFKKMPHNMAIFTFKTHKYLSIGS